MPNELWRYWLETREYWKGPDGWWNTTQSTRFEASELGKINTQIIRTASAIGVRQVHVLDVYCLGVAVYEGPGIRLEFLVHDRCPTALSYIGDAWMREMLRTDQTG